MNINGTEYENCKTCGSYQTYGADGKCEKCGRQLIVISESVVLAQLRSKYGVE